MLNVRGAGLRALPNPRSYELVGIPGSQVSVPPPEAYLMALAFFFQWLTKWTLPVANVQPDFSAAAFGGCFPELLHHVKKWHCELLKSDLESYGGMNMGTDMPDMGAFGLLSGEGRHDKWR